MADASVQNVNVHCALSHRETVAIPGRPVWTMTGTRWPLTTTVAWTPHSVTPGAMGKRESPELTKIKLFTTRQRGTPGQKWETVKEKVTSACLVSDLQSPRVLLLRHKRMPLTGKHY